MPKISFRNCKEYCGIACASGTCVVGGRAFESCLGDFLRLVIRPRHSLLLARYILDCLSRARLFRHPMAFLTAGVFYDGRSGPLQGQRSLTSLTSLFSRRRGSTLSPFVCRLSHRPSLSSNPAVLPRRVPSA